MAASEPRALSPALDSPSTSKQKERPHLLHNIGASFLNIAHKAYSKAPKLPWPLGSLTQTLASIASPVVHSMQYQWLVLLYFIDEQILTVEDAIKFFFPPSSHVFEKIDMIGDAFAELLMDIDSSMDCFPGVIHEFTNVNSVLTCTLGFLASMLPTWTRELHKKEEEFTPVEEIEPTRADDELQFTEKILVGDEAADVGVPGDEVVIEERGEMDDQGDRIGDAKQATERVELHAQPSSASATIDDDTKVCILQLFEDQWIQSRKHQ